MISKPTTADQIDAWRKAESESETLEFKEAKNHFDFDKLLKYCVALANERGGRLLLGIKDKPPRPVVGTAAFPSPTKTANELFNRLGFRVDIEEVAHPNGRVLVFHIPCRPLGHAYDLDGSYWMRSGESLVAMTMDQLKQIAAEDKLIESPKTSIYLNTPIYIVSACLLIVIVVAAVIWQSDQPSGTPEKLSTGDNVTAVLRADWHNKQSWRSNLRVGMTKAAVQQLFGDAENITVSGRLEEWRYGSGIVTFIDEKLDSWSEPDKPEAEDNQGIDSKKRADAVKKEPSPPAVIQAPYGNLKKRCEDLGDSIIRFAEQRSQTTPDFSTYQADYWDWYRVNDGQFRFRFYNDAKALQKDLALVNVKDRRLDELIAEHENYFAERNKVSSQTVAEHSSMYHLSIEDIKELGQRFKFLATQIP